MRPAATQAEMLRQAAALLASAGFLALARTVLRVASERPSDATANAVWDATYAAVDDAAAAGRRGAKELAWALLEARFPGLERLGREVAS